MKNLPLFLIAGILCLGGCNKSKDPDIQILRSVAADKNQPEYIRESVKFFDDFLQGETVSNRDYVRARSELSATRNKSTLASLIAILHSLENRLPEQLPTEQYVKELSEKYGEGNDLEYKIAPVFILGYLGNLIPVITYYDVENGDREVDGFFARFETNYGASLAGKYWLEWFRMEWKQALEARVGNDGKWYSGRKKMGLE